MICNDFDDNKPLFQDKTSTTIPSSTSPLTTAPPSSTPPATAIATTSNKTTIKWINTLVFNMKNDSTKQFKNCLFDGLTIGNLIIIHGHKLLFDANLENRFDFNRLQLKVLTLINVDLEGMLMESVEASSVKSFYMDGDNFERIEIDFGNAFSGLEFVSITKSDIYSIDSISDGKAPEINAFERMKNLKFLILSHNQIKTADWLFYPETRDDHTHQVQYPNLIRLDLSYNQIKSIDSPDIFNSITFPKLKYLNLNGNEIVQLNYLHIYMFDQLIELWINKDVNIKSDGQKHSVKIIQC